MTDDVATHFTEIANEYDRWKRKARYYYDAVKACLREVIPPGAAVCEVGCGTGDILASLAPAVGVGVDVSARMIELAGEKHHGFRFDVHDIADGPVRGEFDFVVAADVVEHLADLATSLTNMRQMLGEGGRIVLTTANPCWAPILETAERLRLKMPEGEHQWRTQRELEHAADVAALKVDSFTRSLLMPKDVPLLRQLNTARWACAARARYGLIQRVVLEAKRI